MFVQWSASARSNWISPLEQEVCNPFFPLEGQIPLHYIPEWKITRSGTKAVVPCFLSGAQVLVYRQERKWETGFSIPPFSSGHLLDRQKRSNGAWDEWDSIWLGASAKYQRDWRNENLLQESQVPLSKGTFPMPFVFKAALWDDPCLFILDRCGHIHTIWSEPGILYLLGGRVWEYSGREGHWLKVKVPRYHISMEKRSRSSSECLWSSQVVVVVVCSRAGTGVWEGASLLPPSQISEIPGVCECSLHRFLHPSGSTVPHALQSWTLNSLESRVSDAFFYKLPWWLCFAIANESQDTGSSWKQPRYF